MGSIQAVTSSPTTSALQYQKPAQPAVPQGKDQDGDVDKAGAADRDKGNNLNVMA